MNRPPRYFVLSIWRRTLPSDTGCFRRRSLPAAAAPICGRCSHARRRSPLKAAARSHPLLRRNPAPFSAFLLHRTNKKSMAATACPFTEQIQTNICVTRANPRKQYFAHFLPNLSRVACNSTSSSTKSTSLVASSPKSEQVATLFFPASTPPTVASHPHSCSCIAPAGARLCCARMHRRESASSGREQLVRLDATEQTTGIQAGVYCPLHLFGDLFE